jgi:hypothetical protein
MPAMSRREVLALAGAALTAGAPAPPSPPKICIFSKHLQWLNVADAARLAADIGFDGIDLTVRKGGHIEPSRAAEELPRALHSGSRRDLYEAAIKAMAAFRRGAFAEMTHP